MIKKIYFLPGRGGQLTTGLGQELVSRRIEVFGREAVGEFVRLSFAEQVDVIAQDLQQGFWQEQAMVLANSFGAYLLLHALASLKPYPGRLLLLSPILGEFANEQTGTYFSPPYPKRLGTLAQAGQYPTPRDAQIHVGEHDWQSIPQNVQDFGALVGMPVTVVPDAGHRLPKPYV